MNFQSDIFTRANLQEITAFLATGEGLVERENGTYEQRIKNAGLEMEELLEKCVPDFETRERLQTLI